MSGGGGAHGQRAREQCSNDDVERIRQRAERRVREKDEEIAKLKQKLDTSAKDLKKMSDHSKHQSQELFKLKESQTSETALKEEIRSLEESLRRLGQTFTALEKENEELQNQAQISRTEAELYKEDFMKERRDREKAAGKLDSLQRTQVEEIKCIQKELSQAKEDAQAKVSQVKQYKKQLDTQEAKTTKLEKEKRELSLQMTKLEKEKRELSLQITKLEKERHDLSLQIGVLKKENSKLQHQLEKAQKKEEKAAKSKDLRAGRKERETSMKEEREKRKKTMAAMDMKGRSTYLEGEIARLEEENHQLKAKLDSSEAVSGLLVSKLDEAESRLSALEKENDDLWSNQKQSKLKTSVEETQPMFNQSPIQHGPDSATGYINFPGAKHQRASQEESDYMYIDGSQSVQVKQEKHNHSLVPPEVTAKHHHAALTAPQPRHSPICTQDPALLSKTHDYVNLPPEECVDIAKTVPAPKGSKKPHAAPRSNIAQRRAASMDTDKATSRRKSSSDHASLPEHLHGSEGSDDDISNSIDTEIQHEATEVAASSERDARRNTLKNVPFDPFLKCLYCNRMFRYGEIQKYKKHVLTCTESSS